MNLSAVIEVGSAERAAISCLWRICVGLAGRDLVVVAGIVSKRPTLVAVLHPVVIRIFVRIRPDIGWGKWLHALCVICGNGARSGLCTHRCFLLSEHTHEPQLYRRTPDRDFDLC